MKRITIILLLIIIPSLLSYSQKRYGIWFMPSKAKKINGIALNPWKSEDNISKRVTINGAHIQFSPLAPVTMLQSFTLLLKTNYLFKNTCGFYFLPRSDERKIVNGINLTICDRRFSKVNGLDINIGSSEVINVNGVLISGLFNVNTNVEGLAISLFCNKNKNFKGLEISMFNNTKKLYGVQIGLWNRNQKRSLPIINWCFKKR